MSSSETERVRFSGDLIGESGDRSLAVSHFSKDFSIDIVIGIGRVCNTGFGIRCGFLRQLRALRVLYDSLRKTAP